MNCPNCGVEVSEKDRFCEKCGKAFRPNVEVKWKIIMMALVLGAVLIGYLVTSSTSAPKISRNGLVGEWHFDEGTRNVVKDSSGNRNDGVIYGATFVDGKVGKALSFNRVDDYVGLRSVITDYMTVSLWYKAPEPDNNYPLFLSNGYRKSNSWGIIMGPIYDDKGKLSWTFENASGGRFDLVSSSRPTYDEWHNLVITYSSTKAQMYIDSVLDVEIKTSGILGIPGTELTIGQTYSGSGFNNFNGFIDEVRIYDRALNTDEIKALYEVERNGIPN